MRGWLLAVVLFLAPQAVLAAEAAPAPPPETLALARQLIELSGKASDLHSRMRALMEPMMRSMVASLPPDQRAQRQAMFEVAQQQAEADTPLILDAAAQAYAQTYTADELRQLVAFYQGPTGRMLTAKQGALATNMGQATAKLGPKLVRDILVQMCSKTTCPPAAQARIDALAGAQP
jgi:hypothetical protein